jgi:hypothetical protein
VPSLGTYHRGSVAPLPGQSMVCAKVAGSGRFVENMAFNPHVCTLRLAAVTCAAPMVGLQHFGYRHVLSNKTNALACRPTPKSSPGIADTRTQGDSL